MSKGLEKISAVTFYETSYLLPFCRRESLRNLCWIFTNLSIELIGCKVQVKVINDIHIRQPPSHHYVRVTLLFLHSTIWPWAKSSWVKCSFKNSVFKRAGNTVLQSNNAPSRENTSKQAIERHSLDSQTSNTCSDIFWNVLYVKLHKAKRKVADAWATKLSYLSTR